MSYSSSMILKAIDQISPTLNKVKVGMKGLTSSAMAGAKGVNSIMSGIGPFIKGYGILSGIQAIQSGFSTLTDFSEKFQGVKSVAEVTGVSFEQLEKQAKELGRTTRYTATDAAGAQYFLAKAGFDTKKIYDSMPDTLLLASAANLDIAQSADIVTNIMAGYQLQANELGNAVDVLAKSFSSANTDLVDLGTAMKYAGPVASGMGIKFNEAAAALGMMGNAGIQGSMAGTSLRGALTRLAQPTKQVARYIRALKLDIYDSKGNIKSLTDIVEQLEKRSVSTGHMIAIFGQRAGPAMAALVSQGSKALKDFQAKLDDSSGFAKKAANIRLEGLYGSWIKLKSAIEGVVHSLGDSGLTTFLTRIIDLTTQLTNAISDLIQTVDKLPEWANPARWVNTTGEWLGDIGGDIGRGVGLVNRISKSINNPDLLANDTEKLVAVREKIRKAQANNAGMTAYGTIEKVKSKDFSMGELKIKLDINDKNNQVGKVEAKTSNMNMTPIDFKVGRSSAGY